MQKRRDDVRAVFICAAEAFDRGLRVSQQPGGAYALGSLRAHTLLPGRLRSTLASCGIRTGCMATKRLFLIGLMAVGKTTVGKVLAASLGWRFVDTDHLIQERAGADVSWIFDVEGEAGFRERETAVIEETTLWDNVVLATGGGAVLDAKNRAWLGGRGTVLYLDSSLDRLVERTRKDQRRPLLAGGDVREKLAALKLERGPLYAEIADYRFVTDRQGPRVLARRIEQLLRKDGVL